MFDFLKTEEPGLASSGRVPTVNRLFQYKRKECGHSQFGSSRERIAAANAANVQYAGRQKVIIMNP